MRRDEAARFAEHLESVHPQVGRVLMIANAGELLRERKQWLPPFIVPARAWVVVIRECDGAPGAIANDDEWLIIEKLDAMWTSGMSAAQRAARAARVMDVVCECDSI